MNYEDQNTQEDYAAEFRSDVVQFQNNRNDVALFGVCRHGYELRVEIPVELRSHVWVAALTNYINNEQFNLSTRRNAKTAFEYLLKIFSDKPDFDMGVIGFVYLEYLKKLRLKENTIHKLNQVCRSLFTGLADSTDNFEMKVIIRDAAGRAGPGRKDSWGNWPRFEKPEDIPRDSLACEFGSALDATNEAFLSAFVEFNQAFITEWNSIRDQLRTEHTELHTRLVEFVESVGIENLNRLQSYRNVYGARENKKKNLTADDLRVYEQIVALNFEIMLTLDNAFLNCLAFGATARAIKKPIIAWAQKFEWTKFDTQTFVKAFFSDTGTLESYYPIISSKLCPKLPYNLLSFLQVSEEEQMCFMWLLAMYRAPLSGMQRLKLDEIDINDRNYYVDVFKGRQGKTENPNFPINSPQGRTLKLYLKSLEEQTLPTKGIPKDRVVGKFNNNRFQLVNIWNFSFAYFFTINDEDGSTKKVSKYDVGFTSMTDVAFNLVRDTFLHMLEKPNVGRPSLAVTKFSQAYLNADQSKRGDFQKSNSMANFTYDEEDPVLADIAARKNFHSFETQNTVYRARSRDKLVLKMGDDLGLAVNAEMGNIIDEILAKKLDPDTGETRVLTHDEYRSAIGMMDVDLDASPEALRLAAQAQNFIVEESGLIQKDGKVIVIDDAMTAFLMSEKMKHIEEAAGEGFTSLVNNFGREQIIAILTEYWLLEALYERLSVTSRHAAKKPPYSNLVGKFKFIPIVAGGVL